ncbi:MAG: hypothetical protein MJ067_05875 [Oscillospiraceae bacterium]|nr:hypothetical protein [Oscillospiraceae bacterium]
MEMIRPAYGDPSVETQKVKMMFSPRELILPKFKTPITPRENLHRAAERKNPLWAPNTATDMVTIEMYNIYDEGPEGYQLGPNLASKEERYLYHDAFGNSWTYDRNAGGSCMTIGTRVCDDILEWENQIKFPDLHEYNIEDRAKRYVANEYDPTKAINLDLYHGPFQALSDLLGGFAEALEAMFVEPEACRAFYDRFADWMIWLMDKLFALYPADMVTIHDDWGTERDTFFSPKMLEELLYEPTKKMIDFAHSKGVIYQFHNCGANKRFLPYFADIGAEFFQLQRRVNDLPAYKKEWGNKIGYYAGVEGFAPGKKFSHDEIVNLVRASVDTFAPGGGWLAAIFGSDPEAMWDLSSELYCYSSEFYAKENSK